MLWLSTLLGEALKWLRVLVGEAWGFVSVKKATVHVPSYAIPFEIISFLLLTHADGYCFIWTLHHSFYGTVRTLARANGLMSHSANFHLLFWDNTVVFCNGLNLA